MAKERCKDIVGKDVVLIREITTRGGIIFDVGEVMRCYGTHRGMFHLEAIHKCDRCARRSRPNIRHVERSAFKVLRDPRERGFKLIHSIENVDRRAGAPTVREVFDRRYRFDFRSWESLRAEKRDQGDGSTYEGPAVRRKDGVEVLVVADFFFGSEERLWERER